MKKESEEINSILKNSSPTFYSVLSELGKRLYMPKGIIFQSNQSKKHANHYNASIGIAKENIGFDGSTDIKVENLAPMTLNSIGKYFSGLEQNEIFNYAPQPGLPALRDYWHDKIVSQNPCLKSKEQISRPVLTGGLTHAISLVAELFTDPGDDLYLADKFWENYSLIFDVKYQVNLVHYKLYKDDYSAFNLESLENTLKKSKKDKLVLLFNFPNNPTGYTATEEEMDGIRDILVRIAESGKKIVAICDDAYYGLFYDKNIYPGSLFSKLAGVHDNIVAVKIDGVSKEAYAWGFRVGFITFADNFQSPDAYGVMEEKAVAGIRCSVSSCSSIAQAVLNHAIKDENYTKEIEQKYSILKSRVAKVKEIVYRDEYKPYWDVYPFNSGYFMCLRIKDIPGETVRKHALFRYGLGTIAFDQDLRIAFSCISEENLEKVFLIIAKSIDDIKNGDIETGN